MHNSNIFTRWWLLGALLTAVGSIAAIWFAASRQNDLCLQLGGVCENSLSHPANLGTALVLILLVIAVALGIMRRKTLMIVASSILLIVGVYFAGAIALLIVQGA